MYDKFLMDVVYSLADLPDDQTHFPLLHAVILTKQLQQLSSGTELHQQVYILLVREIPVQRRHVAVV